MKKIVFSIFTLGVICSFVFLACDKKNDNKAIAPGYKSETGSGGNPNVGNITSTTGQNPNTNLPTNNSQTIVGGAGWSFTSCGSGTVVSATSIVATKGSEIVTLNFLVPPTTGIYNVASSLGANNVVVTVQNASGQPAGITWYGSGGTVSVITSSNSVNASFNTVYCKQANIANPIVNLSGTMGCI